MSSDGFHHRSSQKKVKTKHTSKSGKGKAKSKGKVEEKQRAHVKAAALEGAPRDIRVNRSKQLQKQKREDAVAKSRIGGNKGPNKIVALISLGPSVNLHHISTTLARHSGGDIRTSETSPHLHTITSTLHGRTRHIYCYETPRTTNAVLDIAKVADIVVFVMGADEKEEDGVGEDTFGKHCITILQAQGLPTIMGLVQAPLGMSDKKKHALRHTSQRYFDTAFGHGNVKMVYLDECDDSSQQQSESATQVQQFFRWIHEIKLKPIHWREHRVYGMFEPTSYTPTSDNMGTLCIRGQLRGSVALNVNQLVHLTGYGDYQIQQIDGVEEERIVPTKQERRASRATLDIDMDGASTTLKPTINTKVNTLYTADTTQRESLDMLVPIDPLAHEQSIITEDDLPEEVKKSTQDVWDEVVEHDDEEQSMYGDETKSSMGDDSKSNIGDDDDMDADLDMDPSLSSLRHRHDTMSTKEREEAEKEDAEFPDEVEFPMDTKCKIRLARYRGLKSFEKSPWDHNENLPLEYSEIYQFANFGATYKRIMKETQLKQNEMDAGVAPNTGQQVIIHLISVPTAAAQQMREAKVPLILFGLYTYEHKVSVLHYQIARHGEYQAPIKSKDEMEIHCGFRRFIANPIYSKYKTDPSRALVKRWFHQSEQNTFYQASVYGQIMYPPANVLMFSMNATESPAPQYPQGPAFRPIAASGSFLTVDPNRLLIKRIVLTGSVVSSHKRSAVVRHMFFNADDVRWFKPVELRTADGLVGHIREPRGTKGCMKCLFDQHIKQSDVVRMYLYKRQYPPRWKIQSFGIVGETK